MMAREVTNRTGRGLNKNITNKELCTIKEANTFHDVLVLR